MALENGFHYLAGGVPIVPAHDADVPTRLPGHVAEDRQ